MQRESIIDACQIHSKPFRLVFPPDIEKKTNQVGLALRQPIQVEVIDWENSESEKNSGT